MSETDWTAKIPEGKQLEKELAAAYRLYQYNIRQVDEAVYRITLGARNNVPEKELFSLALEALDRCRYEPDEV